MEFSLRRHVWVIDLIGILFGAGLAGHAVATRLAPALPTAAPPPPACLPRVAVHRPARISTDAPAEPMSRGEVPRRILKLGPHLYEVPRGILDQMAGISPPAPMLVPETRHGMRAGVRIFDVDLDGLPAAMGIVSGDLVMKVNGVALTGPDAALTAYTTLKTANHAWVVLERHGRRIRLDYVIR